MDKTILISGGTSGLGLATSELFLSKGATVIIASRSEEKFKTNFKLPNDKLFFIKTDFSDMESVKSLYNEIQKKQLSIDIAINNVGYGNMKPFLEYTEEDFNNTINVNLKSLWLSMKLQIPIMNKESEKQKQIINISSINGLGGADFLSLYSASKAGVISLTKSVALEFSKSKISINAIVPGPFETPMLNEVLLTQAQGNEEQKKAIEEQYKQFIPKGRFGNPDEVAQTILWLCEGNNNFISGHSLIIDGGLSSRFR